jgi:hypothetical protein
MVQGWLKQGEELDGKIQPILLREWPTGTFVGAGSLWSSQVFIGGTKTSPTRPLTYGISILSLVGPAISRAPKCSSSTWASLTHVCRIV